MCVYRDRLCVYSNMYILSLSFSLLGKGFLERHKAKGGERDQRHTVEGQDQ